MASLDSVYQKIYRAKHHFDELSAELSAYYETNPGDLFETSDSTPALRKFEFREKKPIPTRLALICGDALQCLRSSLDYLVWELVDAAGNKPHQRLMFPISLTVAGYKEALTKRKRLDGVDPAAIAIIDALQPFHLQNPKDSPLAVLDELTNINKHRRVILTGLASVARQLPIAFPHIMGVVSDVAHDGTVLRETPLWGFVRIQDGFAQDIEITNCVDTAARCIGEEILPHFKQFFK